MTGHTGELTKLLPPPRSSSRSVGDRQCIKSDSRAPQAPKRSEHKSRTAFVGTAMKLKMCTRTLAKWAQKKWKFISKSTSTMCIYEIRAANCVRQAEPHKEYKARSRTLHAECAHKKNCNNATKFNEIFIEISCVCVCVRTAGLSDWHGRRRARGARFVHGAHCCVRF